MSNWTYPNCVVVEVHDGDTISVDIDLGQQFWVISRAVRLTGIAARELKDPGGPEARDYLRTLLPVGTTIVVVSTGWDKYAGRIDGLIVRRAPLDTAQAAMIAAGYAVAWDGRGVQPKPLWPPVPPS